MKRIAVTGASGRLASVLIPALVQHGYDVTALSRNQRAADDDACSWIANWMSNPRAEAVIANASIVVQLAGGLFCWSREEYIAANLAPASRVLKYASSTTKIIHLSAIYADSASNNWYSESKGLAERAIHDSYGPALILRPDMIVENPAKEHMAAPCIVAAETPRRLLVVGPGERPLRPVRQSDVVQAVLGGCMSNVEGTYDLAGPDTTTAEAFAEWQAGRAAEKFFYTTDLARKYGRIPVHMVDYFERYMDWPAKRTLPPPELIPAFSSVFDSHRE